MIELSILDQVVISDGKSPRNTLENTVELAKLADRLGYKRYWIAEHHNIKHYGSPTPEIIISSIASQTTDIRVGTGGILLQHYSPYKVSENLKLLEEMFPCRIDAGFGRTTGGDEVATKALQGTSEQIPYEEKIKQVKNLLGTGEVSFGNESLMAGPYTNHHPEIWLLGTGTRSAEIAAEEGLSFAFGHFINPNDAGQAIDFYIENFKPTKFQSKPKVALCVNIICADTIEKAEIAARSTYLMGVFLGRGLKPNGYPSPNNYERHIFNHQERQVIEKTRKEMIIGTPEIVLNILNDLSIKYNTNEFIILTNTHNFQDKIHSYKLLAEEILNNNKLINKNV